MQRPILLRNYVKYPNNSLIGSIPINNAWIVILMFVKEFGYLR